MNRQEFTQALNKLVTASPEEVIAFIKRTDCYADRKYSTIFWQSHIPIDNITSLITCGFWDSVLLAYFSKDAHVNINFLNHVLRDSKSLHVITSVKLRRVYGMHLHWQSLSVLEHHSNIEYRNLYKELLYIKKITKHWSEKAVSYQELIKHFTYEEILIQTISYFQKFKNYSKRTYDNRALIISYEAILIEILNRMIEMKRKEDIDHGHTINKSMNVQTFKARLQNELPPIKPSLFEFPEEYIGKKKRMIRDVIEFFFAQYDENYQMNKYLSGFAEFDVIDGLDAELTTNEKYSLYRKTLEKGTEEENYLTNIMLSSKENKQHISKQDDFWNREFELKRLSSLEYFKFYKLPSYIKPYKRSNIKIATSDLLRMLQVFSACFMPQGRTFTNHGVIKRNILDTFKKVFDTNYMVTYEEDELINKVTEYFSWSHDYSKAIIGFLTTDISSKRMFGIDIKTRPFLKIGNQYYWLSSFMRDRKWEVLLHRRMVKDKTLNHRAQSDQAELYLAELFSDAGFTATASFKYQYNGKNGEIDTLAYKDNTLFILELKNTYPVEDMLKTNLYEVTTFSNKAVSQLERALDYVQQHFTTIKDELNIDCELNDLRIQTVIVSNIFQADNLVFNDRHFKVSIFELAIILKNDLYNVMYSKMNKELSGGSFPDVPAEWVHGMVNVNNEDHKDVINNIEAKDYNLWSSDRCSADDVISSIKGNKVFKHMEAYKGYPIENFNINKFLSRRYID